VVDAREGRGKEGFNKKKYDEGYLRAFGLCRNTECPLRYKCYRFLRTPEFRSTYLECTPSKEGCEFFVKDQKDE